MTKPSTITLGPSRPTIYDVGGIDGAIDVLVTVARHRRNGRRRVGGYACLIPTQGGYEPFGSSPDQWVEQELLAELDRVELRDIYDACRAWRAAP